MRCQCPSSHSSSYLLYLEHELEGVDFEGLGGGGPVEPPGGPGEGVAHNVALGPEQALDQRLPRVGLTWVSRVEVVRRSERASEARVRDAKCVRGTRSPTRDLLTWGVWSVRIGVGGESCQVYFS